MILCGWVAVTWWGSRAGGKPERRNPTNQLVKGLLWVLGLISGGTALISIARPIADLDRLRDVTGNNPVNPEFVLVGWGSLWVTAAVLIGSLVLRRTVRRAWRLDSLVVVVAAVCLFTLAAKGIEGLTHHSLFLSSLLGTFCREPTIDWWSSYLVAGAGCLSLVLFLAFPSAFGSTHRLMVGFRGAMIVLGVLTFVNIRYLRTVQEYREYVRAIVCFGVEDGAVRWVCEALPGPQEPTGRYNSPATPTPVVEGDRVYAYFGNPGLICCDTTGRLLWVNGDLPYESSFGPAASPVVADGLVIITSDPSVGRSRVWAVDGERGEVRWVRGWAADGRMVSGNSRTPVVASLQGRRVLLHWGYDRLRALDVATGEDAAEYRFDSQPMDIVASAVCDGRLLYMAKTGRTDALPLERLATNESPVLWTSRPAGVTCSIPAIARGMLFLVTDGGMVTCLDMKSGRVRWRERLRGRYYASVVATDESVYFLNDSGQTTVVRCDAEFIELAVNDLREETFATPALASGFLSIRTATTLYCIGR